MDKQTSKRPFPSKYSPGKWITPAQYIVELVCEQAGIHSGKDLPVRFWNDPEWASFFRSQTNKANQLVKKYDAKAIITTIKKKRLRSLMAKWVEGVIQKEQQVINAAKKANKNEPKRKSEGIISKPRRRTGRVGHSNLDTLLALDEALENGEEKEASN